MNILSINGTPLTGIYVDAAVSFNKPSKRVTTFSVPGRNGDLVIDEGTFDNVLISYPVYEKTTFPQEFDSIVNWLASLEGYQKIQCSNDPQHYRLGRFVVPVSPTAKRLNKDGYYTLSFDCKPQRWLLSGEEDTEIDANPIDEYSGALVSFNAVALDEITELKAAIEPVQDLNGQTSPWPAGGGVNIYPDCPISGSNNSVTVTQNGSTYALSGTASAYTQFISSGTITLEAGTYMLSCFNTVSGLYIQLRSEDGLTIYQSAGYGEPSTQSQSFTLSATTVVKARIVIQANTVTNRTIYAEISKGSTAPTSWSPYSNICPISGHTEVNVYRTGADLCSDIGWENGQYANGVWENNATRKTSPFIPILPNTSYKISVDIDNSAGVCFINYNYFDANKTWLGNRSNNGDIVINGLKTHTLSISNTNVRYLRVTIRRVAEGDISSLDVATANPKVEQLTTYPISLGQTVYGGTLNVTTGVLTIDRAMVDLGDLTWTYNSSGAYFYTSVTGKAIGNYNIQCSAYKVTTADNTAGMSNGEIKGRATGNEIFVKNFAYTDKDTFKTAMSGVQLVYELATPIEVDITAVEIAPLVGDNNIWADCGDVEVEVTTPTVFNNPSPFNSKPLIRVYGAGNFKVNDITVTIASHDKPYIDIDCELQECYCGSENMNEYVSFSGNDFPELQPGDNYMLLASGITKLDVTPRWWIL